ncbi:MAG: ATP cone domain-containing protein, partial [Caldicoprobacterales bacterium]
LVQDIEKSIYGSMEQEITSQKIGQMVMERLKDLDQVAYVRFASVYRQFKDVNNFIDELEKMLRDKGSQED